MAHINPDWEREAARFRASLAELLFAWNGLEAATRYLLDICIGVRSYEAQILTADLGVTNLQSAIRAMTAVSSPEVRDHAGHYLDGFDRLRLWRNYLVHCPVGIAREGDKVGAWVREIRLRGGRLTEHQTLVTADTVERVTNFIAVFHLYLSRIIGEVYNSKHGVNLFSYESLATGNKPELPEALKVERPHLAIRYQAPPMDGEGGI